MNLLEELQENLAYGNNGAIKILNLPANWPAYTIKNNNNYGVAVPFNYENEINERFSSCHMYTCTLAIITGQPKKFLILDCSVPRLHHEFATVCAQFVATSEKGTERKELLEAPVDWWKKWRDLLGNKIGDRKPYSVIAEMLILNYLYKNNKKVEWAAVNSGSNDIESDSESYEVKSTIARYGYDIKISGQHQFHTSKKLFLFFCRVEESPTGYSINDIEKVLIKNGYDANKIEQEISSQGFELGSSIRERKYKIHEAARYLIDDSFPKITKDSFPNGHIPNGVKHISYTIDLTGLNREEINDLI